MHTFPFGEAVTLHARTVTGQDADGNDVFGTVDTPLTGVPVWAATSTENTQGQDVLVTGLVALLPPGMDVSGIDSVTVYGDAYEVDGEPGRYVNPFTGTNPGVEVHLIRVGL